MIYLELGTIWSKENLTLHEKSNFEECTLDLNMELNEMIILLF